MISTMLLYYDDLQPGQVFSSPVHRITAEEIKQFALQFDPQPFHYDDVLAQDSFFNGLAASGWHTGAITMRLLVESLPIAGGLVGAGLEELRWFRPVRPDEPLRVETEILSMRLSQSNPSRGLVRIQPLTFGANNDLVQRLISTIVVPTQPR